MDNHLSEFELMEGGQRGGRKLCSGTSDDVLTQWSPWSVTGGNKPEYGVLRFEESLRLCGSKWLWDIMKVYFFSY